VAVAVPIGKEVEIRQCQDPTTCSSSVAQTERRRAHIWAFEAHRKGGEWAPAMVHRPPDEVSACVLMQFGGHAKAKQEKLENVKWGVIEEKQYEGNPVTCCVAVVTDVGLEFGVRGQSQVNGEGVGGIRREGTKMSRTSTTSG
jgi:hypothetical protein